MKEIKMVLADLFVGETQSATTARLASGGMRDVYQGKVSRWLNNVQPSLEQLAEIERIYGQPRGWILWRAGFINAEALAVLDYDGDDVDGPAPPADVDEVAQLRAEVDGIRADIRELRGTRRSVHLVRCSCATVQRDQRVPAGREWIGKRPRGFEGERRHA